MIRHYLFPVVGIILGFSACRSSETNEKQVLMVKTETVKNYENELQVTYPGRVKAAADVDLAFRVAGPIIRIPVQVGSFVRDVYKRQGLGIPRFKSTRIPSTITIALSTSIPIATIKAARETRCKVPSSKYRITKAPKTIMTRPVPIITPLRNPIVSINTRTVSYTHLFFVKTGFLTLLFCRLQFFTIFYRHFPAFL